MATRSTGLAFSAAQVLMFGCISLIQVAPGRFFVPLLLAMHVGILLFARLKRRLPGTRAEIAWITRATYLLMGMYLPVLAYKLADRLGLVQMHYPVLYGVTIVLAALAAVLVICSLRAVWLHADG